MVYLINMISNEKMKMVIFGIREGYWFYFNDEGVDIVVNGFMWFGWEMVYVNDNFVLDKCEMFKVKSSYIFIYVE